jgi:hypothetical protein
VVTPQDSKSSFVTRHRFVVLFITLVAFFVALPIIHQLRETLHPATAPFMEGLLFIAVLVSVVVSISTSRLSKVLAPGLGLPVAVLAVLHAFHEWAWLAIIRHLLGAVFLGFAIAMILRFTLASRQITFNTVCASLCTYLLLGVLWGLLYSVVDNLDPAAFHSTMADERSAPFMRIGSGHSTAVLYFSFATLTTLGYGDIVPVSPIARMLASLEAITGQLYLAVLVARLVGLHIAESLGQK